MAYVSLCCATWARFVTVCACVLDRAKHMGEEEYDKMEIAKALGYMNKAAGNFTVGDMEVAVVAAALTVGR
jgi:hypothetical protein